MWVGKKSHRPRFVRHVYCYSHGLIFVCTPANRGECTRDWLVASHRAPRTTFPPKPAPRYPHHRRKMRLHFTSPSHHASSSSFFLSLFAAESRRRKVLACQDFISTFLSPWLNNLLGKAKWLARGFLMTLRSLLSEPTVQRCLSQIQLHPPRC